MHVLWHDGDSLGVDGAEVGVFEERNEVGFGGFLEGEDGGGLESEVRFEFLSDFSDESLERQLSDEELGRFLVSSDLSECDCSWSISVRFLHASALGGGLSGSLLSNVFSWGFSSCVLPSGLLGSGHFNILLMRLVPELIYRKMQAKIWAYLRFYWQVSDCLKYIKISEAAQFLIPRLLNRGFLIELIGKFFN